MSILFIPDKIRIGFQLREDTYTGKLAYVIYYDAKGKLRKEKSWQGWRDDKIEPVEFDNKPQDGFVLNKGIRRYSWSDFSSNRSMIRIYDSRGIEFEVTPENLIGLLMETNCSKRGLEGEFVYAWCGTELVLLPCSSEEYTVALKNTVRQGKKISARDLKPGCSYTTKNGEEVIYMGRFPWFTWSLYNSPPRAKGRISQRKHIFARAAAIRWGKKPKEGEYEFFPKGDASFLAELNNEDPVPNYADLVDQFNGDIHSSVIEGWETKPFKPTDKLFELKSDGYLRRATFTEMDGDVVTFWNLTVVKVGYSFGNTAEDRKKVRGYRLVRDGTLDTKKLVYESNNRYYHYHTCSDSDPVESKEAMLARLSTFVEVDAVLASGKRLRLKNIQTIARD